MACNRTAHAGAMAPSGALDPRSGDARADFTVNLTPGLAAQHFQKIECFCFTQQPFQPGEARDMPVTFRIDPALPPEVRTVMLSYTFFKRDGA